MALRKRSENHTINLINTLFIPSVFPPYAHAQHTPTHKYTHTRTHISAQTSVPTQSKAEDYRKGEHRPPVLNNDMLPAVKVAVDTHKHTFTIVTLTGMDTNTELYTHTPTVAI